MTTEETSTSAPDAEASRPSAREQSRQLLGRLVEAYPKAFFSQSARQVHPLKLGIHKDLQPVIKDWGYEPLALKLAPSTEAGQTVAHTIGVVLAFGAQTAVQKPPKNMSRVKPML